jgi:phosphatidylglycerophosphate synthase
MTSVPFAVASLRLPADAPFVRTTISAEPRAQWVARTVTFVRIPIAAAGILAIMHGDKLAAILAFALFAIVDLFDGVAARRVGCDTATRRAGDVLLDRTAIHLAAIAVCAVNGVGWLPWLCLLSRDVVQAVLSAKLAARTHAVIVGAHWHMSYGLSMLVWGSVFIAIGYPPLWLTILTGIVSIVTFGDYARRSARLERRFLVPEGRGAASRSASIA